MLPRLFDRQRLYDASAAMPVVLLVGPRQCGKSTMSRALVDVAIHGRRPAGNRIGVEVRRADAPVVTASMRSALSTLELDRCVVLYPGTRAYRLGEHVRVEPVHILGDPPALREALGI